MDAFIYYSKYHFFVIKDPFKISSKNSKFYLHNYLANIVMHVQAKYRKDRMKTKGAYFNLTDGQTDVRTEWRTTDLDKLRWLSEQRS